MKKLEIQKIPASHGWLWIKHGYNLILRNPMQSILLVFAFALGVVIPSLVPVIGPLLAVLVMPALMAGYMRVCRSLEYSEIIDNRFILAGFESRTVQLLTLGALLMLGILIISTLTAILGGAELQAILENFKVHQDPNMLMEALLAPGSGVETALMVGMFLFFGLIIALQYAPMLVYFNGMSAGQALKISLLGTLRNIVPYLVYSMIMQLIAFAVSVISMKLGWIIMLPIAMTSMYVSYRDIFSEVTAEDATERKAGTP